jgi:molybdenum cofactor synthesis domain-containing protein
VLLTKGTRLGAMQVGVCAAVGKARVRVFRRPRVAVLATGAELRPPGAPVRAHQSRNANGPMLRAALETWGYPDVDCGSAPDRLAALISRLRRASAGHDVLLLTGGVSVGKYDFVRRAVEAIGGRVRFHGVAMKPGKPLLYATLAGNRHVFGLPGNPLSAMTGFYEFVLPALARLAGAAAECGWRLPAQLAAPLASKGGPVRFALARVTWGPRGLAVEPVESRSSADLVAGGRADGAIAVPAGVRALAAGAMVEFRPWRPLP